MARYKYWRSCDRGRACPICGVAGRVIRDAAREAVLDAEASDYWWHYLDPWELTHPLDDYPWIDCPWCGSECFECLGLCEESEQYGNPAEPLRIDLLSIARIK